MPIVGAVADLVRARARHRVSAWVLVAAGTALAAALPVASAAASRLVAGAALEHGLQQLPAGQRSVTVSYNGFLPQDADVAEVNRLVGSELARLSDGGVLRQLEFRRISDSQHHEFVLGGADHLSSSVRLLSGRMPSSCTPTRCEVVVVGTPLTPDPALGLVVVGPAARTDPLLLSGTFDPGPGVPLLLADGVDAVAGLSSLEVFQRSYGWVSPVDLAKVRHDGVPAYLDASASVADRLWTHTAGLVLTAPDDTLQAEDQRASGSGQRFALLGAIGAVLVLGLALVGAVGARRDHLAVVRTLRLRGAATRRLAGFTLAEASWPVLLGAVVGIALCSAAAAVVAGASGSPVGPVVRTGLTGSLAGLAVLVPLSIVAVALTLRVRPGGGERAVWHAVELAAAVLAGTALLVAARGGTSASSDRTDPLLVALPLLVVTAAALLAARLAPPLLHLAGRALPHRALTTRTAVQGPVRRPIRAATTVAVLTATVAAVVFATGYRATLQRGAEDQAAYAVPTTAVLRTGPDLAKPVDVATGPAVAGLGAGVRAYPVLRTAAQLAISGAGTVPVQMLGVEPGVLPEMAQWRDDYANRSPAALANDLRVPVAATTSTLPAGRVLRIPYAGSLRGLDVIGLVRDEQGVGTPLVLTQTGASPGTGGVLVGSLPQGRGTLALAALTIRENTAQETLRQHHIGESGDDLPAVTGTVAFAPPTVDGQPVAQPYAGWSSPEGSVTTGPAGVRVRYQIAGDVTVLRVISPSDARPVPAIVDRVTAAAAHGGVLQLQLGQLARIRVKVVATGSRFPTTTDRFAVVDRVALARTLDDASPGTGTAGEVWVTAPASSAAHVGAELKAAPFDRLATSLRADRVDALRTDPVAVGAGLLLLVAAGLGLLVAVVAVVLLVVAERREAAGELYALEADGMPPRDGRRLLLLRAVAVVVVGVPAGLVAGALLTRWVARLVAVTAGGTTPVPPLRLALGPAALTVELAGALLLALLAAALVASRSLREPLPVRPETDLR